MRTPITSTYRLQLRGPQADPSGRAFGFSEAENILPYLHKLGISHVYLSPILTAWPASNHNYDVTDPTQVNPELGGIEGLRSFVAAARALDLGVIVDIVPNHVSVDVPYVNDWWWDVLKHGEQSVYEPYFDIDWHADNGADGKLGLPILGAEQDIRRLRLTRLDARGGELVLAYYDNYFPLTPGSVRDEHDDPLAVYERQHYKLMYWRDGVISYRRFFSVNGLAGIKQELPAVFEHTHRVLKQLIAEDLIDGVRVDHPDGLANPFAYLAQLRELIGADRWLVVEKILEVDEALDPRLRVDGTTGYDALREFDGIFIDQEAADTLSVLALQETGSTWDAAALRAATLQLKRSVASEELAAEVRRLARALRRDNFSTAGVAVSDALLTDTVVELIAAIPVYRADYRSLTRITASVIADMAQRFPTRRSALDLISAALLANGEAATRFAQVCGAVMAKGVEDTLFYRASRLVALQEVGGAPERFGVGAAEFHLLQHERAQLWPRTMTTLTTHDTKRSEDTRARIITFTEVPQMFAELVRRTTALLPPPDTAAAHFLLQNVLGIWPTDGVITEQFRTRVHAYTVKALREASVQTTWFEQDHGFEQRVIDWIDALLQGPMSSALTEFVQFIQPAAAQLSLGRKVLQMVGPGIPDTYQGQEYFDCLLVDPDNRGFVDYTAREQTLELYQARSDDKAEQPALVAHIDQLKQGVIYEANHLRKQLPQVFLHGGYQAVFGQGTASDHLVGIARSDEQGFRVIGLATRLPLQLAAHGGWGDTTVQLPQGVWKDVLTGTTWHGQVLVRDMLATLPTALLVVEDA